MRVGSLVVLRGVRTQGLGIVILIKDTTIKVAWGGNFIGWAYPNQLEVLCE
jgi:hypothetical protein